MRRRLQEDGKTARRQDGKTISRGDARVARDSMQRWLDDPGLIEIRPEPSPSERAAILIALEQLLGRKRRDEAPHPSAWALAGRRESLLDRGVSSRTAWGRGSDRLTGR